MRASGLPVTLRVEGERPALSAGADLAAFRVLQEALGEALTPGGAGAPRSGSTSHRRGRAAGRRRRAGPRRALLGMRERVALYGGELGAGARRQGGHVVRVRLPAGAAP